MSDQREFWNERFGRDGYFYGTTPNLYLKTAIDIFSEPKKILFLGEGEGRNALYAAQQGHSVTALDASEIGLAKTAQLALEHNVSIALEHTDLELWNPSQTFDSIMCSFLHLCEPLRSEVFAKALHILDSGGLFVGEFFSIHQLPRSSGGPKDIALLYTAEQLQTLLSKLPCDVVELCEMETELSEGKGHNGIASVLRMKVQKR